MNEVHIHRNQFGNAAWMKEVGEALTILLNSDRKGCSIASIGAFVMPFAKLRQLKIFYGYNEYPAAYMTWGYLTQESISVLQDNPGHMLDIDDLNAGTNLVIFDILSKLRNIRPIIREIRALAKGSHGKIYGLRYNEVLGGLFLKEYNAQRLRK